MLCKGLDIKLTMLLVENLMEQEVILVVHSSSSQLALTSSRPQ